MQVILWDPPQHVSWDWCINCTVVYLPQINSCLTTWYFLFYQCLAVLYTKWKYLLIVATENIRTHQVLHCVHIITQITHTIRSLTIYTRTRFIYSSVRIPWQTSFCCRTVFSCLPQFTTHELGMFDFLRPVFGSFPTCSTLHHYSTVPHMP